MGILLNLQTFRAYDFLSLFVEKNLKLFISNFKYL